MNTELNDVDAKRSEDAVQEPENEIDPESNFVRRSSRQRQPITRFEAGPATGLRRNRQSTIQVQSGARSYSNEPTGRVSVPGTNPNIVNPEQRRHERLSDPQETLQASFRRGEDDVSQRLV